MAEQGEMCSCGRPRSTTADLQRWVDEYGMNVHVTPEPEWARAICWTVVGFPCNMRPISKGPT